MSWLRQGLTQSISGSINQLKGQLEDILTESTDDIINPVTELKAVNEKLKEADRQILLLKTECTRWQDESNELNVKCQTYEAQLNQKCDEFKKIISEKDAQLETFQKMSRTDLSAIVDFANSTETYQKSALMEDFEEISPQNEFSEYINLQKEIKRLNEENRFLVGENRQLDSRVKALEDRPEAVQTNEQSLQQLEAVIDGLKQQIFSLQSQLEAEKDKHQEAIISIEQSYKQRVNNQLNETLNENVLLKEKLQELEFTNESQVEPLKISSNKSDDGWCINDELSLDVPEIVGRKEEVASDELIKLAEVNLKYDEEVKSLKEKIIDLEREKVLTEQKIDSLGLELKQQQESFNQEKLMQMTEQKSEKEEITRLNNLLSELKMDLTQKIHEISELRRQIFEVNENVDRLRQKNLSLSVELQNRCEELDTIKNQNEAEISKLRLEVDVANGQRKQFEFVLEEKSREISKLKNEIQAHLQHIEMQSKALEKKDTIPPDAQELMPPESFSEKDSDPIQVSEQFSDLQKIDELAFFKNQYNQIYGYLEQKNVESLSYYNEIQRLNSVICGLNAELQTAKNQNESLSEQYELLIKDFQLQQTMLDELNQQTSELNLTLSDTKNSVAAHLSSQKLEDTASNSCQQPDLLLKTDVKQELDDNRWKLEVDEILTEKEAQIFDLNKKIDQTIEFYESQLKSSIDGLVRDKEENINELNGKIADLNKDYEMKLLEKEGYLNEANRQIGELNERIQNYENELFQARQQSSESERNEKMSKELQRLKEHLVEMSDSYNNDAIQAEERERQLRLALAEVEKRGQEKDENLANSSKEIEEKIESLSLVNDKLCKDLEISEEKLKKSEASLSHQVKVTKNLELVLERLQNDQNNQHSMEIKEYQKTIKEQGVQIYSLQRENKSHQQEVNNMKEALNEIQMLELELKQKDESIKQLKNTSKLEKKKEEEFLIRQTDLEITLKNIVGTKDALILSLEKQHTEVQKLNNDFIEKEIIKSLVIGYVKVQKAQEKSQVLKLIGTMLGFTSSEFEQVESATESKWFGLYKSGSTPSKSSGSLVAPDGSLNQSFTDLFIQYVDRESKPKPNFSFDVNTSVASHKKTDGSPNKNERKNENTTVISNPNNAVNRNSGITPQMDTLGKMSGALNSSQIASPATANSFLEQILK